LVYFSHNSPADRTRELFKPSKDAKRYLVSILKTLGRFGYTLFVGYVIIGTGLGLLGPLHLALTLNRKRELCASL